MTRQLPIDQPFDLALSLTMGQAFRWYELPQDFYGDGNQWFSGVLGENLVHIRQTESGVEYRVAGRMGSGTMSVLIGMSRFAGISDWILTISAAFTMTSAEIIALP